MVSEFSNEHRWLSNFVGGLTFTRKQFDNAPIAARSVEHAYQAFKTTNREDFSRVLNCATPGQAKRLGRKVEVRDDWDIIKVPVMTRLVELKFKQHPVLRARLIALDGDIVEGNRWHDNFWGDCYCPKCIEVVGQNIMGQILMNLRDILREDERA